MYILDKNKIHSLLKKNGLETQQDLAIKLDMSTSQLSHMIAPKYSPIKQNVLDLCAALNVNVEDILLKNEYVNDSNNQDNFLNLKDYESFNFTDVSSVVAKKKYNVLELFAGAAGLGLGLEKAGLNTIGALEFDKDACNTMRINRPDWNIIEGDIIDIANNGIQNYLNFDGELDLLSGGYPCQSYSYAGKKAGMEDTRGTLFYPYAQILKQLKPKVFVAENVRGLVSHDKGRTLATMLQVFKDVGYKVQWKVLKAVNYDVAQKRERIFIVGIRDDLANKGLEFSFPSSSENKFVLKDVLKDVPDSPGTAYSENRKKILDLIPPGGYWRDLPEDIAKDFMGKSYYSGGGRTGMARRLSWDEPSLTLTTSPSQKQTERCHPDETRPFTIREYARIQSFPDNWKFSGSISSVYKQIGNAVPVNLATYVGKSIVNFLNTVTD